MIHKFREIARMSFVSSEPSSRQIPTLPRQDTATTMSSFSTSCSNLDTTADSLSNASSLRRQKPKHSNHKKRRKSVEHFVPFGDEKTLRTLKVHYYPEGHWGYAIIVVVILVQTFNHGLHLSYGMFLVKLLNVYGSTVEAGDYDLNFCRYWTSSNAHFVCWKLIDF